MMIWGMVYYCFTNITSILYPPFYQLLYDFLFLFFNPFSYIFLVFEIPIFFEPNCWVWGNRKMTTVRHDMKMGLYGFLRIRAIMTDPQYVVRLSEVDWYGCWAHSVSCFRSTSPLPLLAQPLVGGFKYCIKIWQCVKTLYPWWTSK